MPLRTMLAAALDESDLTQQLFNLGPLCVQPKYDGIRVQVAYDKAYSGRNGKLLPNAYIQEFVDVRLTGSEFDGEMVVLDDSGKVLPFGDEILPDGSRVRGCDSLLMSVKGEPNFLYVVFDKLEYLSVEYTTRLAMAKDLVGNLKYRNVEGVDLVESTLCESIDQLLALDLHYADLGFEGFCARLASGVYKLGRSTLRERLLLKRKSFVDDEATVVGFEELYSNQNPATRSGVSGLLERASSAEYLVPQGTLGALVCYSPKYSSTFKLGTGYSAALRQWIWERREELVHHNTTVSFKYQPHGTHDKPRCPVFLRFRKSD